MILFLATSTSFRSGHVFCGGLRSRSTSYPNCRWWPRKGRQVDAFRSFLDARWWYVSAIINHKPLTVWWFMRRMHFCALFFPDFFELFRLFVVCFPPVGHAGSEAHFHFDWSLSFARAFSRQQGDDRILATEKNFTFTRGIPDDSLTFFFTVAGEDNCHVRCWEPEIPFLWQRRGA